MGARATHALACDGEGCHEVFLPAPRLERWENHLGYESRVEVMVMPRLVSAVRTEALRAGWSHIFHEQPKGKGGPGWYEDWCPTCTTKEPKRA